MRRSDDPRRDPALLARHRAVYSLQGMPPFEHEPVGERLRAGRAPLTEVDVLELKAAGVTHVLDLREEREWSAPGQLGREAVAAMPRHGLVRTHLPTADLGAPSTDLLWRAHDWLRLALSIPAARPYVHCRAGIERTGTVLLAFVADAERLELEPALARLRQLCPRLRPLPHQADAVARWLEQARARREG